MRRTAGCEEETCGRGEGGVRDPAEQKRRTARCAGRRPAVGWTAGSETRPDRRGGRHGGRGGDLRSGGRRGPDPREPKRRTARWAGRRPAVGGTAGSETPQTEEADGTVWLGEETCGRGTAGSETRAEQKRRTARCAGRRPAVGWTAGSETRRTEEADGTVCGEETCGRVDGGVRDPRRTEEADGTVGGEETCGRVDGGVRDPRRTETADGTVRRGGDLRSGGRRGPRTAPNGRVGRRRYFGCSRRAANRKRARYVSAYRERRRGEYTKRNRRR